MPFPSLSPTLLSLFSPPSHTQRTTPQISSLSAHCSVYSAPMSPSPSRDSSGKRSSGRISIGHLFRRSTSGSPSRETQHSQTRSPVEDPSIRRQSRPLSPTSEDEGKPGSPSSILATLTSSPDQPHRHSLEIPPSYHPEEGEGEGTGSTRPLSSPTHLGFTHESMTSTVDVGHSFHEEDRRSDPSFLLRSRSRHRLSTSPPNGNRTHSRSRKHHSFDPETATEDELRQFCRRTLHSPSYHPDPKAHTTHPQDSSILIGSSNTSSMDSELRETVARVGELKDALQETEARLREKEEQMQRMQKEHSEEVARLDKDMVLLAESAREVSEMVEMWEKRAREAEATCQEVRGKAEEAEAQQAELQARIDELQGDLVEAEERVNEMKAEMDGPSKEDLKGRIQELEDALLGGEDEDERKDEEVQELRKERDAVERALEETEGRLTRAQKEAATLRGEVNRLTDIVRTDAQASAASNSTGTAERRIQDLEREVSDLRENILASEELEREWKERYRELMDLYEAEISKSTPANAEMDKPEAEPEQTEMKKSQEEELADKDKDSQHPSKDKEADSILKKEEETEEDWQIQIHLDPTDTDTSRSAVHTKAQSIIQEDDLTGKEEHELVQKIRSLEREKRMLTERTILLSQRLSQRSEPQRKEGGSRGSASRKAPHFSVYRGPSQPSPASAISPAPTGVVPGSPGLMPEDKNSELYANSSSILSSGPYIGNLERWRMQIQSIKEAAEQERARAQEEAQREKELRAMLEKEGAALSSQLRDLYLALDEKEEEIRKLEDRLAQSLPPLHSQASDKMGDSGKHKRTVSFERVVMEQEAEKERMAEERVKDEGEEGEGRQGECRVSEEWWKEREQDMEHQVRVAKMERDAAVVEGDERWEELAQAYTRVRSRYKAHRALSQRLQTALGQMIAQVDAVGGDLEGEWLDVLQAAEQEMEEEEEEEEGMEEEGEEEMDQSSIASHPIPRKGREGGGRQRNVDLGDEVGEKPYLRSHWLKGLVEDEENGGREGEIEEEEDASSDEYPTIKQRGHLEEDEVSSTLEGDWEGLTRQLGQIREEKDDAVMALERARLLTGRQERQLSRMEEQLREREAALRVAEEMAGVMREELVRKEREMGEYRRRDGSTLSSSTTSLTHHHGYRRSTRRTSVSGLLGERPSLTDGSLLFTEDMHTLLRQNAETLGCLDELCDMAATAISQVNVSMKASVATPSSPYRSSMNRRSISGLLVGGTMDEGSRVKEGSLIRDGRVTLDIAQRMIDGVRSFGEEVQEVMETYVTLVEQERAKRKGNRREGGEEDPEWMVVGEVWLRVTSQYLLRAESWVSEMLGVAISDHASSTSPGRLLDLEGNDGSFGSLGGGGGGKVDRRRQQQLLEEKEELQGVIQKLEGEVEWLRDQQVKRQSLDKDLKRALVQEVRYQRAKAQREAGFRADLGFQKRYFLLMIGGLEMGEAGTLRMISELVPTTPAQSMMEKGGREDSCRVLLPIPSLRAVVLTVVAVMRLRRLAGEWDRIRALKYAGGAGAPVAGPGSSRDRLARPLSPGASTVSGRSRESRGRRHNVVGMGYEGSVSAYRKL
ncbi:MAG: hypothetical protein DHS80DRAFT_25999 [Piptocephalis tieghemiana]|nr:MAG: hypothetical protein DHS80DRAFT_25999 [Piptocephalis tieghemiana]